MPSFAKRKRFRYGLLSGVRLLAAGGILVLFLRVFTSSLQRWSAPRAALMDLQFTGGLADGGLLSPVAAVFLVVAALLGRWYCSAFCPFGTLQEAAWRAGRLAGRRGRYVSPWRLRYLVPLLAGIGFLFAVPPLFVSMDPLSHFGRGVRGVYALATEGVSTVAPATWGMPGLFAFVLAWAALRGRRFCDWCPAGILLGACASVAPFGMRLRKDACVSCGSCERACPMNCIDAGGKRLERDRCVLCLSCAGVCPVDALDYGSILPAETAERDRRRAFLREGGGVLGALAGAVYLGGATARAPEDVSLHSSGAESALLDAILPPGAQDAGLFFSRCIGCRACVAACPAGIVRADRGAQPRLDYTRGYCQYNCTECARTCPTHALRLPGGDKQRTRIGLSELDRAKCVVVTRGESCGACAEVCPTHALRMEPLDEGSPLTAPVFDPAYCIGCGGCFNVCPAEPRAFVVRGVSPQTLTPGIRPPDSGKEKSAPGVFTPDDAFPF